MRAIYPLYLCSDLLYLRKDVGAPTCSCASYTKGIRTVTFHREFGSHLHLKDVMYVPRMKKNVIYVAILEDRSYDVIFSKAKPFLRDVAIGQVK